MPTKLKILIALIALGMLGSLVSGLRGSTAGWLSLVLDATLLVGLAKGKEGARNFLMLLAVLGLLSGAFGVLLVVIAAVAGSATGSDLVVLLALAAATVVVLGQNAFALWCLSRRDVQRWMFQRSLGALGQDVRGSIQ